MAQLLRFMADCMPGFMLLFPECTNTQTVSVTGQKGVIFTTLINPE